MSGKRKKDPAPEGRPDARTTIRAKVTPAEAAHRERFVQGGLF